MSDPNGRARIKAKIADYLRGPDPAEYITRYIFDYFIAPRIAELEVVEGRLLYQHQAAARAAIRRIELADRIRLLRTVKSAELHFSNEDFVDIESFLRQEPE